MKIWSKLAALTAMLALLLAATLCLTDGMDVAKAEQSGRFYYTLNTDEESPWYNMAVLDGCTGASTNVTIPDRIDGHTVYRVTFTTTF